MDGDAAVESELDALSLAFPLPYRVAFIVVLAVWGWGVNLHYLHTLKIDVPSLIRYPQRPSSSHPPHHLSTYRLAAALSATLGLSLTLFWLLTRRDARLVLRHGWLPLTYLLVLAALFALPLRRFSLSHAGRSRLLATLRRVAPGGIADGANKFADILLADVLTSYAKVLADLYVCVCMALSSHHSAATARPDRACGGRLVVPLILAAPYAIRLRQCLIEFLRVRDAPYRESVGWGGQHLANAAKYATAFPVIIFSALLQRNAADENAARLHRCWVVACLVNSAYSFYWDVAKDWDLTLFSRRAGRPDQHHQPFGLRRRLLIAGGAPMCYYLVIVADLMLRCTWSLKLSPHLGRVADLESSIFAIELLEVFRRWVWIFFRVETEWLRNNNNNSSNNGLGVDDILLGDYQGKFSDEEDDED